MPSLDAAKREISCKLVYYGAGLSGKTTNLQYIHSQVAPETRGELVSTATQTERTLFFDFMPLDLGTINGWRIRLCIYTVPGQAEYYASRKMILNGADALVFVADSNILRSPENLESLRDMRTNLKEFGMDLDFMPWVLQYNKRDLTNAMTVEQMENKLNMTGVPSFESVAIQGFGIIPTLKEVTKLLINDLSKQIK